MDRNELLRLKGFYENELTNRILAFWLPRCEDREYGGYVKCFDNAGEKLQSYTKSRQGNKRGINKHLPLRIILYLIRATVWVFVFVFNVIIFLLMRR